MSVPAQFEGKNVLSCFFLKEGYSITTKLNNFLFVGLLYSSLNCLVTNFAYFLIGVFFPYGF
jgi:hypothetical protein